VIIREEEVRRGECVNKYGSYENQYNNHAIDS
jgi:hypothetical protein